MDDKLKDGCSDEEYTVGNLIRSLASIATGGISGYFASVIFGWTAWICIVAGLVIGLAAPGLIIGFKEAIRQVMEEETDSSAR